MTEIEVGFCAVVQHIDFPVLKRIHRPRIDIEIRIELLEHNPQTTQLKQRAERGCGQTFAQRTHDATGNENVFHETLLCIARAIPRAPAGPVSILRTATACLVENRRCLDGARTGKEAFRGALFLRQLRSHPLMMESPRVKSKERYCHDRQLPLLDVARMPPPDSRTDVPR